VCGSGGFGSFKPTEFDFALVVAGQRPITGFDGLLSGCGKGLSTATQRAGTTQHVNLIFVTDARQGEIVYRPLLSPAPVGSWTVG
jgi:hypothetical protein